MRCGQFRRLRATELKHSVMLLINRWGCLPSVRIRVANSIHNKKWGADRERDYCDERTTMNTYAD